MYLLIAGFPPFRGKNKEEIIEAAVKGKVDFTHPSWKKVSEDAKKLILQLLTFDQAKRITISGAIKHPWILKYLKPAKINLIEMRKAFQNLRQFKSQNPFQQAVLSYIASHQMKNEEEVKIREMYSYLDQDKDGNVSKLDITNILMKIYKCMDKAKKEAEAIFTNASMNGSMCLSYNGIASCNNKGRVFSSQFEY